jgi:hypothetical protein
MWFRHQQIWRVMTPATLVIPWSGASKVDHWRCCSYHHFQGNDRCSFDEQYAQGALLQAALASAEPARRVPELMLLLFGTAKESFTMTRFHTFPTLICLLLAWLNTSSSSTGVLAAFTPQQPLSFNSFTGANESWFEYPETASSGNYTITSLLDKPQLGIAISGGGFRYLQVS